MQKVQPAKNNFDMNFLNSFDKPIGGNAAATTTASPAVAQPVKIEVQAEDVTEIDPTSNLDSEFDTTEIDIEDEAPVSRTIKATQIVVRTTEKEREALKAEQQEKKGLVHFSDIGLY